MKDKIDLIPEIDQRIYSEVTNIQIKIYIGSENDMREWVANGEYGDRFEEWAANNGFCDPAPDFELPDGDENPAFREWECKLYDNRDALEEYAGHDCQIFKVFESLEEVKEFCKTYKGHKWVELTSKLESFCFEEEEED
jgi:hypothetical protein